jgi:hypothetical protein
LIFFMAEQLDLSIPEEFLAAREKRGEFTGDRLALRRPDAYRASVNLLALGATYLSIAKTVKISVNSVAAVARREHLSIESQKKELSSRFGLAAGLAVERIIERLENDEAAGAIPLNQLAVTAGISTDKKELLGGGATQRIEWVAPAPAAEDYLASLAAMRLEAVRSEAIEAEAVDADPDGTGRGKTRTKAAAEATEAAEADPKGASHG